MRNSFRLVRVFGIEIAVHSSWFVILIVVVFSLATGVFPTDYPRWSPITYWVVSVVAALLLFLSVVVHELAHSLVATSQGIPVKNITLFLLGGVSSIEKDASSPGREALLAGIGPLSSFAIAAVFFAAGFAVRAPQTLRAIFLYLGYVNVLLAVFNLLPGFPLDGGRVLRAVIWSRTGDFVTATRWATRVGHVFGYALIFIGILTAFAGNLAGGLWTGFIGWVLMQASQASYAQTVEERGLAGIDVGRIMTAPEDSVPPDITLARAADEYFLAKNARCLPVQGEEGRFEGIVCFSDLQRADRSAWRAEQVQDVMTRRDDLLSVTPDTPAAKALRLIAEHDVNQLAVVSDGDLVGFFDRSAALRYLSIHGAVDDGPTRRPPSTPDEAPTAASPPPRPRRP
jgi:Zn-dependent protease/CBS domain-containing protein